MRSKKSETAKRLEQGYYKNSQVDIDSGDLSITLLQKLIAGFENSMKRFPNCCVFRVKLRVPKTYNQDANKLLNTWFYSLAKPLPNNSRRNFDSSSQLEPSTEAINMIWAKDMSDDGSVFYRIALFFRASKNANEQSSIKAKAFFKRKLIKTWAYALRLDEEHVHALYLVQPATIIPLIRDNKAHNEHLRFCFFILSTLARKPRCPQTTLRMYLALSTAETRIKEAAEIKNTS